MASTSFIQPRTSSLPKSNPAAVSSAASAVSQSLGNHHPLSQGSNASSSSLYGGHVNPQPTTSFRHSHRISSSASPAPLNGILSNGLGSRISDSDSEYSPTSDPSSMSNGNGGPTADPTQESLLQRLERENASLRLDPKSVLAEKGNLMTHLTTMQTLSEYHTKLSSEMKEEDVAFWNSVINDHRDSIKKFPHLLIVKIRLGIPPQLRSKIWQMMAGANPSSLAETYEALLKEESPADRIIKRDIPRTFPKLDMFKDEGGPGQRSLYNLLKAYSIYDVDCGYCQGLSFVVAPLLLQNMSELECFSVFVRLMEETPTQPHCQRFALRSLFTPQMPGLHLILYQHSELVRLCLPQLYAHFVQNGVMADTYASPWFLTLFTYNFPLSLVFRIFDIIFAEGATETMLRFSIAILKRNQDRLMAEHELECILELLKGDKLYKVYEDDPERVVQDAMQMENVITDAVLEKLVSNYHAERMLRSSADMEVKQLRWETQRLSSENGKLTREVTSLREALKTADERRIRDLKRLQAEFDTTVQRLQAERVRDTQIIEDLRRELNSLKSSMNGVELKSP